MSFLSKLSNLRKSATVTPIKPNNANAKPNETDYRSLLPENYIREEDPAVKRLKERRRQEALKRGELAKKTKGDSKASAPRRRKDDDGTGTETRFKRKSSSIVRGTSRKASPIPKKTEPIKKLSFQELMEQAENNARKPQIPKDEVAAQREKIKTLHDKDRTVNRTNIIGFKKTSFSERNKKLPSAIPGNTRAKSPGDPPLVKINLPQQAQPHQRFKAKLMSKERKKMSSRKEEDYGSDLDDFIEDDDADADSLDISRNDAGFDRDEIWAMFNRGKKRSDYAFDDYEDDDMEANEMEILEEEERARKMAKLEDKREEEWLKKHEQQKKKRKGMR